MQRRLAAREHQHIQATVLAVQALVYVGEDVDDRDDAA